MKVTILGVNNVSFKANDGKDVKGCRIWYSFKPVNDSTKGVQTDTHYFSDNYGIGCPVPDAFVVGNEYDFEYSVYGSGNNQKTSIVDIVDVKTGKSIKTVKSSGSSQSSYYAG